MRFQRILLFTIAILTFAQGASYTLDQLLEEAYRNSRQLQTLQNEIQKAESQVNGTLGSALPSVILSANVSHAFAQYNAFGSNEIDTAAMNFKIDSLYQLMAMHARSRGDTVTGPLLQKIGPAITGVTLSQIPFPEPNDNTVTFGITVNQPLFAQGKVRVGLKIAKLYQATLLCKYLEAKMLLKARIMRLYYRALLAQNTEEIKKQALKLAEETHRLTVVQNAAGNSSDLDTLSSRIRVATASLDIQRTRTDKLTAYDALITATGIIDRTSTVSVQGDFPPPDFTMTLEEAESQVHKDNMTLKQLRGNESIQEQMIRLARTDFYPLAFATASIGQIGQFSDGRDMFRQTSYFDNRIVGLGLSWTIFRGFQNYQKLIQAKIDLDNFKLNQRETTDNIDLAVRTAYEQLTLNLDQVKQTEFPLRLAEKAYSISKVAYEIGSKTLLDVQNAEYNLNDVRMGYSAALFAFHMALIDLKVLMGTL